MTRRSHRTSTQTINCTTESAAVAFSNTFAASQSPLRSAGQNAAGARRISIDALPTELLVLIFKYVYMKSRVSKDPFLLESSPDFPYETTWATDQDLLSPSLFPYALALVCSTWRDIMSTVPVFWSRVLILIDANPTPLLAIQSYLEWTRDVPLDVNVIRKPGAFDEDDPDEKARVKAVVDLLGSHVHRCRSLQFDVLYSSSLPSPCRDFHGRAPELEKLELKCRVDDGGNNPPDTFEPGTFLCPVLQTLVIDARNFMINAWTFINANSIKISRFSPSESVDYDDSLSFHGMLETLQEFLKLRSLTLSDIDFDFSDGSAHIFPLSPLSSLTFEDLTVDTLQEFFDVTSVHTGSITITRCSIDTFTNMSCTQLTLGEIPAEENLTEFLKLWEGQDLQLDNCPSFDDSVLDMMSKADPLGVDFGATNMNELTISDCHNFSVEALKAMVDVRSRTASTFELEDDDWDDLDPSPVSRIGRLIVVSSGPLILPEVAKWFQANVEIFHWCTKLPDGRMCRDGVVLERQEED